MLHHLAALDADDMNFIDMEILACGWDTHELALVGAVGNHPAYNLVALGDEVLDMSVEVREGSPEHCDRFFHPFCARLWNHRVVLNGVDSHEIVYHCQIPTVESLLDKPY